jgi:hypothetical protein
MRHPFDGLVEPEKESRRSVLLRALAAVAGLVGLGVAGCGGTNSGYTVPTTDGTGSAPAPKGSGQPGYATTFAIGEEGGSN